MQDLGALTGPELCNMIVQVERWQVQAESAPQRRHIPPRDLQSINRMYLDLVEFKAMVVSQIARIDIPLADAARIIHTASRASRHPMRVAGTQ